jgi:hypothetical protein
VTPPGFSTDLVANTTTQCPIGEYRADWKPANLATACLKCGSQVKSLRTDTFKTWDIVTRVESQKFVTTSADDCYIEAGQGLYYLSTTASWRAKVSRLSLLKGRGCASRHLICQAYCAVTMTRSCIL